jgi:hypothetical protein
MPEMWLSARVGVGSREDDVLAPESLFSLIELIDNSFCECVDFTTTPFRANQTAVYGIFFNLKCLRLIQTD